MNKKEIKILYKKVNNALSFIQEMRDKFGPLDTEYNNLNKSLIVFASYKELLKIINTDNLKNDEIQENIKIIAKDIDKIQEMKKIYLNHLK